jgi:hypothetical protein
MSIGPAQDQRKNNNDASVIFCTLIDVPLLTPVLSSSVVLLKETTHENL